MAFKDYLDLPSENLSEAKKSALKGTEITFSSKDTKSGYDDAAIDVDVMVDGEKVAWFTSSDNGYISGKLLTKDSETIGMFLEQLYNMAK